MLLPSIEQLNCTGKRVIVRADLDVKLDQNGEVKDDSRLVELFKDLNYLYEQGAEKIVLIGHKGRPDGKPDTSESLEPLKAYFQKTYTPSVAFIPHRPMILFNETFDEYTKATERLVLLENLRFYKEEEENSSELAEQLSYFGEGYLNEAFASSHRAHASIVALPAIIKQKGQNLVAAGFQLQKEVIELSKLRETPKRPVIFVISGAKEDKLTFLIDFEKMADEILIAGRLPVLMPEDEGNPKLVVGKLNPDKEDITIHTIETFEQKLAGAGTIFLSGPVGKFEEPGHLLGTQRVFEAAAKSGALKIAGGGDTTTAIKLLKLENSFNWISSGGGASLEFVAKGTLPGLEALC